MPYKFELHKHSKYLPREFRKIVYYFEPKKHLKCPIQIGIHSTKHFLLILTSVSQTRII